MDAMPLTQSNKIDRNALPEPQQTMVAGDSYAGPQSPVEETLEDTTDASNDDPPSSNRQRLAQAFEENDQ